MGKVINVVSYIFWYISVIAENFYFKVKQNKWWKFQIKNIENLNGLMN